MGRQHVGHGTETGIGKCCESEQKREQVEVRGENGGDEQGYADTSKDNQRLPRMPERPSPPKQVSRHSAAEKVACVGCNEWHPHADQPASELDPFRHQEKCEPVRDEE